MELRDLGITPPDAALYQELAGSNGRDYPEVATALAPMLRPRDGHPLFTGFIEAALVCQQGELPAGVARL